MTLSVKTFPKGFSYRQNFISRDEEADLIHRIKTLPFHEFEFHGYLAKRRIVSYGYHYDFGKRGLTPAEPVPEFLSEVQRRAAEWIKVAPEDFAEALVTEYQAGVQIGWHRDAPVFDKIVGISLGSMCKMKLKPYRPSAKRQIYTVPLEERSAYIFEGEAREDWQHHIPAMHALRYSITFRTIKAEYNERYNLRLS